MLKPEEIAKETIKNILRPDMEDFVSNLEDADNCICKVTDFTNSLSELTIRIKPRQGKIQYEMVFRAVEYFEGSLIWIGANFNVATFDETIKMLSAVAQNRNARAEDFGYERYLFNVSNTQSVLVRILAGNVSIREISK